MYDLSETEVIVCTDECELCYGGWPQEAFEYVMKNDGIPLNKDLSYDGDYLLKLTQAASGEIEGMSEQDVNVYRQQICPNNSNNGGGGKNNDNNNGNANGSSSSSFSRYGKIKGYGYATKRCVCYTDGSGCNCDSQNEGMAVRNLATYGPAVVCVDASEWKEYTGGVITSASGCSQKFMDVNHCVQVVGYAYAGEEEEKGEGNNNKDENRDGRQNKEDNNNDHKSGDKDGEGGGSDAGQRQGYWIVRNQWSKYWGYSGYAFVAMGENTCGILNDMIQVYS
jgi:Papain family cysteine protease